MIDQILVDTKMKYANDSRLLEIRYCVGNIADISVEVDISTINSDFLPIFHRKLQKKK